MNRVKELEFELGQWDIIRLQIYAAAEEGDYVTAEYLLRTIGTPQFAEIVPHVDYILSFALDRAKHYVEEAGKYSELITFRIGWLIAFLAVFIVVTSLVIFSRVRHLQTEFE